MSGYLLDSHVVLWWAEDPALLSPEAQWAISDGRHLIFVSAATIWELGIKVAIGKLSLPGDLRELLRVNRFQLVPILAEHAHAAPSLPPFHRDPFDRMLVAQSQIERLTLVTRDKHIMQYDTQTLLA